MSDPIPFAGGALDRAGHRRADEAWLQEARADPRALAVLVGRDGATAEPVPLPEGAEPIALLGVGPDDAPVFVAPAHEDAELTPLRILAATAAPHVAGLAAYAAALAHFHRAHRFCGSCGAETTAGQGGHTRQCPNGHTTFPRTDPVVIMLVVDQENDRVLLGRQPVWPAKRYSALAGFVEPGEDLEAAVRREVAEEAGIVAGDVRYVASQPWPFPASLMLGFHADHVEGEPRAADAELEDVRWFTREEVQRAGGEDVDFLEGGGEEDALILPPKLAIARHLVDVWLA